ncbi:MAG: hypothetical protein ACJAU9_000316 [Lentimonas sp.]|jgi:hypothetical protein
MTYRTGTSIGASCKRDDLKDINPQVGSSNGALLTFPVFMVKYGKPKKTPRQSETATSKKALFLV